MTLKYGGVTSAPMPWLSSDLAGHAACRHLGQLNAGGLGDEGHGARRAGIHLQHEDHILLGAVCVHFLDRELHVHQTHHVQAFGHGRGLALELVHRLLGQVVRRQRTSRVTAVHAGLLDVLHHAADEHTTGGIADRVHIALDGVVQEAVQQHRASRG